MIFNRTQTDVENSKRLLKKVKNFEPLSEIEKNVLERGALTIDTINRIELVQAELADKLLESGFSPLELINKTDWNELDFFKKSDLERIVNNTILLRKAIPLNIKQRNPEPKYLFSEFNAIERILFEIQQFLS